MLIAFLIMLREGLEAALIVGIIAAYLKQTGRGQWLASVWIGVVLACVLSLGVGIAINLAHGEFPQREQELFEAIVGMVAVGILTSMVFWMGKMARSIRQQLHQSIDAALAGGGGSWALIGMAFFAVAREGLESVFFLLATFQQDASGWVAPFGAVLGLALATFVGMGIYRGGIRLNLSRFFRVTGVLILFVAAGLLSGSVRALHEAGLWNHLQGTAYDLSAVLPVDGPVGAILSGLLGYYDTPAISEVLAYAVYLIPALLLFLRSAAKPATAMASPATPAASTSPSTRKVAMAASAVAAISIVGLGVYVVTARHDQPADANAGSVTIVVDGKTCRPDSLTIPAGRTTFLIRNASDRVLEWEIIQGVMVIEERENIAPGVTQKLTANLEPGDYGITCSPKSKFVADLRGKLTVTANAQAVGQPFVPRPAELIGALAEYKFYVYEEVADLVERTQAFVAAIKAGDIAQARALYARTRVPYERIEPVAELFADLDASIDSRADDHEQQEADPAFTGFHRLEYALWTQNSTKGVEAVADKLLADVTELQSRIKGLSIPPEKMVGGAAALIEEVAATKISGEEDRYSHTDLWDFQANMEGCAKIVDLLRPMLIKADQPLLDKIDANLSQVTTILNTYARPEGGFQSYEALAETDRNALRGAITPLAEDLAKLRGTLGLN